MSAPLRRLAGIALVTILAVGLVAAPAMAAPTGTVSGRIVEPVGEAGVPVGGVTVSLQLAVYPVSIATTVTDAEGRWRLSAAPAPYKVRFELPGGLVQFHPQTTDFGSAAVVTVVDGQDVAIEEKVVPHGSLGGQITTSRGGPAANAIVGLTGLDGISIAQVHTDTAGRYLLRFVKAATFDMFVSAADFGAPRQWVRQHTSRLDADPVVVAIGQLTTVDEQLLPLGTISGRFSDPGVPVSTVGIRADAQGRPADTVFGATGADGTFTLRVYPGRYTVKFSPTGGLEQWATGQESARLATVLDVAADTEIVLDERALPTGRVSGRLTDADAAPVAGAAVVVSDPARDRFFQATTDADGGWFLTVWPGAYQVRFSTGTQVQWATGKDSPATADLVTVTAGQTTVVDDALARPGALTVGAVDERTGVAVTTFCATAEAADMFAEECTDDGTAEFPALGAGSYTVTVSDGVHLDSQTPAVRVVGGQATAVTTAMRRGAIIAVTVVDAVTGAPVRGVCLSGLPADRPAEPGGFIGDCVDSAGTLTLTRVQPGRWVFFASVFDGAHGAQWVGPHGGVGAQASARAVVARSGASTSLTVRLDGQGSIAGVVTDQVTGQPVRGAQVGSWGVTAVTEADGRYRLDGLGPYEWVVFTGHDDYAGVWSGNGNNRLTATPVRVRLNQVTPYQVGLRRGTVLTGHITGAAGQPPDWAEISVVDARTFDQIAHVSTGPDGAYTVHILGPRDVKLLIMTAFHGLATTVWYPDGETFGQGRTVSMPAAGTRTLDIAFG